MRKTSAVAAALVVASVTACAGPRAAPTLPRPLVAEGVPVERFDEPDRKARLATLFPRLDAHLAAQVAAQKLPGLAFGVVVDGELVYAKGFGLADLDARTPVDADTVFRIGSVTKTFTSLAVLMLRDAGKLSLDEPVARVLPELSALRYPTGDAAPITIRHLLTHTSGLPQFGGFSHVRFDREVTEAELFQNVSRVTLLSAPGGTYAYSNYGVALLGPLVTRVAGVRYRDFVSKEIFAPLGMRSTFWDAADVPKGRLATGYAPSAAGLRASAPWRLGAFEAAGGIYASLRDLARYAAFQLDAHPPRNDPERGPLRRSSVREAHVVQQHVGLFVRRRPPSARNPAALGVAATGVGLAWHASETCDVEWIVNHAGATEGHAAAVELFPRRGIALVFLANFRDTDHAALTRGAREILFESPAAAPRTLPPSAGVTSMMAKLADLYADYSDEKYRALAAPLFLDAVPAREMAGLSKRLRAAHGRCADPKPVAAENARAGRFRLACERGHIEYSLQIDGDGQLVEALATSRDLVAAPAAAPPLTGCPEP